MKSPFLQVYIGICENFGDLYDVLGMNEQAYNYFKMAYEIGMKMYGPNHPITEKRLRRMKGSAFYRMKEGMQGYVPGNA